MGIHGLLDLLAPVGRRVSVETLTGKKLAIGASIWMVQFMKAMRDEKEEMVRNAHILGFFRRICRNVLNNGILMPLDVYHVHLSARAMNPRAEKIPKSRRTGPRNARRLLVKPRH